MTDPTEPTPNAALTKEGDWTWSAPHDGYINEGYRRPGCGWDSYIVAADMDEVREIEGLCP